MVGNKNSGGRRPGAGRPVSRRTLHTGDRVTLSMVYADGVSTLLSAATVQVVSHTEIHVAREDGSLMVIRCGGEA